MAFHNLKLEDATKLGQYKIDFDLFPPFMKTEEFYELKYIIEKDPKKMFKSAESIIFGNHDWLLWLVNNWISSSRMGNEHFTLKQLYCLLSGKPNNKNFSKVTSEDEFFNSLSCLFNVKLIEKYNNAQFVDYEINHINNDFIESLRDDINTIYLLNPRSYSFQSIEDILKTYKDFKDVIKLAEYRKFLLNFNAISFISS